MTVFVSDMHFGRGSRREERSVEDDLIACLEAHRSEMDGLVLLGDVFDHFVEYRHLVPKGAPRLKGRLAEWTRGGLPIHYVVGNHDPWHRDYFAEELGVRVHADGWTGSMHGRDLHAAHGDGLASSNWLYNRIKPLLRHPVLVTLYTSVLPADAGLGLARWWSRRRDRPPVRPDVAADLRGAARELVRSSEIDLVVFAHSHRGEHRHWPEGCYFNTGSWRLDRTYLTLDATAAELRRWNGSESSLVEQCGIAPRSGD